MKKINLLGMNVSIGKYLEFVTTIMQATKKQTSQYACVANVHMLVEANRDKSFAGIVSNADIITPDGMPLTWAMKLLYGIQQDRVAGMDLLPDLLKQAESEQIPVCFYGGQQSLLAKTSLYLQEHYPQLIISGLYSPPFRKLSAGEEEEMVDVINASGAKLVFVVLGCPKQEKWMASMKGRINAVMVGIGGALPVMVGSQKRAPLWMQKKGLEWLFRFIQEPGRLFKRYAVTNTFFLYLLSKLYLQKKVWHRSLN